jgi:hypothetical protein
MVLHSRCKWRYGVLAKNQSGLQRTTTSRIQQITVMPHARDRLAGDKDGMATALRRIELVAGSCSSAVSTPVNMHYDETAK